MKLLSTHGRAVSICNCVYEHSHKERVNDIIKIEYLNCLVINYYEKLKSKLTRAVRLYNEDRTHWSLDCKTPCSYEKELAVIPINERKSMI